MPILKLEDFNIISPSPDNFILRLSINGENYNYVGSGEHVYQDLSGDNSPSVHKSLITSRLAHSSIFEYDGSTSEKNVSITAWNMFDINDVGVTTDSDDEDNDNLLLLQNSNIDPSAKTAIPMHQINSNTVYGYVSAISNKSIGVPHVDGIDNATSIDVANMNFNLKNHESDPITRYHYRQMAVALSSVLGLGTQMNFTDTFDKLFVFDPTDNNRISFPPSLRNWRRYQSNRDRSSDRLTNNFDFGKFLVRAVLFPKATLNSEYSTERQYTEVSAPYSYMRKYAWEDEQFYSNGSFIVLNSREDNCFRHLDISAYPGTMVTSKYSRRFGDIEPEVNIVQPPGEIVVELSDNTIVRVESDYNRVEELSANNSDISSSRSTFKQYMPELINRESETASDTSLMTSKHKANIFDIDIKSFWNSFNSTIKDVPSEVKDNIKDMIRKNLYEMVENIKPAHTKLYRVLINDEGDDVDTSSPTVDIDPIEKNVILTLKANGGYYGNKTTMTAISGIVGEEIASIPSQPTRSGYEFNDYDPTIPDEFPSNDKTYLAQWNPIQYDVIYHKNSGESPEIWCKQSFNYDETKELSSEEELMSNHFENEHYNLIGLNEMPDATGISYQAGEPVMNLTDSSSQPVNLYAVWNPKTYVVSFNGDISSSKTMKPQYFTYNVPKKLSLNEFSKEHYSFAGWDAGSGKHYDNEAIITVDSNITLTAKWEPNKYYVIFNGNEGIIPETGDDTYQQEFIYGTSQELDQNQFIREHYSFDGWLYANGTKLEETTVSLSSDLYLYASWKANDFEITFYSSDDYDAQTATQGFKAGDTVKLIPNPFTKRHYGLRNWQGLERTYQDGATINNLNSNLELTAVWDPEQYTITFDKNAQDATGYMPVQTITYYSDSTLIKNNYVRTGYRFKGWKNGTTIYGDEQSMSDYDGESTTFYAQWEQEPYIVTFNGNGADQSSIPLMPEKQEFTPGVPQNLIKNQFTKKNYEFYKWQDQSDSSKYYDDEQLMEDLSCNIDLRAIWNRKTTTLTFYKVDEPNEEENTSLVHIQNASSPEQSQITMLYF